MSSQIPSRKSLKRKDICLSSFLMQKKVHYSEKKKKKKKTTSKIYYLGREVSTPGFKAGKMK